jgi:hypothetical protein
MLGAFYYMYMNIKSNIASFLTKTALVVAVCASVVYGASVSVQLVRGSTPDDSSTQRLTGYAWSGTIGAISFEEAGSYVEVDEDGYLNGYAWSPNVGWVKFGGLSGFPSSSGGTNARITADELIGWARVCSGTIDGDCASASRTDGWDGWISLIGFTGNFDSGNIGSGTAAKPADQIDDGIDGPDTSGYSDNVDYGVRLDTDTNEFVGFAWGSANVGWVDFSAVGVENYVTCVTPEGIVIAGGKNRSVTGPRDPVTGMCQISNYTCTDNGSGVGNLSVTTSEVLCGGTQPCTRGNKTLQEGENAKFFVRPLVADYAMCQEETLTCVAGVLVDSSGNANTTHMYSRCSVVPGIQEI